jgi:ubiquinone/menaquinone biosynthesis C-methylase UbiE
MYKELRPVVAGGENVDGAFEGISVSTPESWARNFAASTKLTRLQRIKISIDLRYRLIRKYIRPNGKILDAGCGFGEWVTFLNEKGFAAAGLDYSETLIGRLKGVYPKTEWVYGTIENIPQPADKYDGLISWGVIEHNEEGPQGALAEFLRVLKPGGYAVVTVPFEDQLAIEMSKRALENCEAGASREFYCYYMTQKELRDYMLASGFEIVETGLCPPASLGKVLPGVYESLNKFPKIRLLLIYLFGALFFWKPDWFFMTYAVGRKPA